MNRESKARTRRKNARIAKYESVRKQRWGRPEALAAARRYNALARANGMTPTQMALAWCYTKWQVASTIIGVTSLAQLEEDLDAWGTKLVARGAGRDRQDPLGNPRSGRLSEADGKQGHTSAKPPPPPCSGRTRWRSPSIPTNTWSMAVRSTAPQVLGFDPFTVVKTLVMEDEKAQAADRADARQPQSLDQEPGAPDRREVGRALQAGGGESAQRLPGGRHLALRHAQGDAGVHRGKHPGAAAHRHQRRAPRLSGGPGPAGLRAAAGRQARATARWQNSGSQPGGTACNRSILFSQPSWPTWPAPCPLP